MDIRYRNLTDNDGFEFQKFIKQAYGENSILSHKSHLKWFLGSATDCRPDEYETLIAVLPDGRIAGMYGAMSATLLVLGNSYSFCWYVNGMVLPEFRNKGIGREFIRMLLAKFDVCGVIGFNSGVKRNYQRAGFQLFGDTTLRRFIKILDAEAYKLTEAIGYDSEQARDIVPISNDNVRLNGDVRSLTAFNDSVDLCMREMTSKINIMVLRTAAYLNWRYFQNPLLTYECTGNYRNGGIRAYLVTRRERYHPTFIYGTRIIDALGKQDDLAVLLDTKIAEAGARNDSLVEFMFAGDVYEDLMVSSGFTELRGESYEWWPLVTSPIERRTNEEFICLGSNKYPDLFLDSKANEIYFTRGDSDRDRANLYRAV
ncbi:MAG: GNAT family N-acetyltransferase [Dehalococcoidales bacterium]|nr:GNAT family N-acetyltransferase [Dehalococcoidales bacterium]